MYEINKKYQVDTNFKIISVESRKGGVGKTTAALNLADLLLEKGYRVLLLDLDITGTSISGSCNSPHWKGKINNVKYKNDKVLNLLEYFNNHFLLGEPLPPFSTYKNGELWIDDKKINVINSDIYENASLICDPRILFDELHSFWIIEMIEKICTSFIERCTENNYCRNKVVIILDNSPGYVGLGKAVHEWLADIGPENGKFLTVSSFDAQDINSCISSIISINKMIDIRYNTAIHYHKLLSQNVNNDSEFNDISKSFLLKLATYDKNNLTRSYRYRYYKKPNNQSHSKLNIKTYQTLVFNKVPSFFRDLAHRNELAYCFRESIQIKDEQLSLLSPLVINENSALSNVIFYNESINFQFIKPIIKNRDYNDSINNVSPYLKRLFTTTTNSILSNIEKSENIENEDLLKTIDKYEEDLYKLLNQLSKNGFQYVCNLVKQRWHPMWPMENLIQNLKKISYEQEDDNSLLGNAFDESKNVDIDQLIYRLLSDNLLHRYQPLYQQANLTILNILKSTHSSGIYNTYSQYIIYYTLRTQFSEIRREVGKNLKFTSEFKDPSISIRKYIDNLSLNTRKRLEPLLLSDIFLEVCKSICDAQLRIMNIHRDFGALIKLLRRCSIDSATPQNPILPIETLNIMDDIIASKETFTDTEIEMRLRKIENAQIYMRDFRNVLSECVIKQWKL